MERLILDTGVLIALERGQTFPDEAIPSDADIALSAITVSELLVGVEMADERRQAKRRQTVDAFIEAFDVLPFDTEIARKHARLSAHVRRSGRRRGAHDLQIAATARASGRVLVTTDSSGFADLPGVQHRLVTAT